MKRNEYDPARRKLNKALRDMEADKITPCIAFAALVDLIVDWSMDMGGKQVLWDAVGLMHSRVEELNQLEQKVSDQVVN